MKFVVTGALGHIGSYLIRRLPDFFPGCQIVMIDNLATQRYASLFNLPKTASYRFVEGDVTSLDIKSLLQNADALIHLAAITEAAASFERGAELERVNLTATQKVAQACAKTNVPMLMASSTSVYGSQDDQIDEESGPEAINPQSPYAETKLMEEAFVRETMIDDGLSAMIFRFGTIYGVSPGMRFHTAVNKFCWQAAMGKPLTVWTTALDQRRPYLDIEDCVRAIVFTIENKLFAGEVHNVVSVNVTVRDVIAEIRRHVPDLEVNLIEHKIMNELSYEVLNTRMTRAGFQPQRNLSEGIDDTFALLGGANQY